MKAPISAEIEDLVKDPKFDKEILNQILAQLESSNLDSHNFKVTLSNGKVLDFLPSQMAIAEDQRVFNNETAIERVLRVLFKKV